MYFCDTLLSVISKQTMVDPLSLIPSETNFKKLHITRMLNIRKWAVTKHLYGTVTLNKNVFIFFHLSANDQYDSLIGVKLRLKLKRWKTSKIFNFGFISSCWITSLLAILGFAKMSCSPFFKVINSELICWSLVTQCPISQDFGCSQYIQIVTADK